MIKPNDFVTVRPMGSFNTVSGKVLSYDEDKIEIVILTQDGRELKIVYGSIFKRGE